MGAKKISIIIPCRNEEDFINRCLDSIIASDFSKNKLEVLVVDGMSKDKTRNIIIDYVKKYSYIRLLDNPRKIIPTAMNIGIKNASGDIIMKIDAHTVYKRDYITKCVKYLDKYDADNVGGLQIAVPRNNNLIGKAIVISLSHIFGVGNSMHRLNLKQPIWADTTYSGCYKRDVFDRFGFYDENIARSEDVAINSKIIKGGGKILLVPEIKTYYYARSDIKSFIKHNFDNGFWITYPLKFDRVVFSWRHLIPLAFVVSLIGFAFLSFFFSVFLRLFLLIFSSYGLVCLFFSIQIAFIKKDFVYLFLMPVIFALLHIMYGLGSIWGLVKVVISKKFGKIKLRNLM